MCCLLVGDMGGGRTKGPGSLSTELGLALIAARESCPILKKKPKQNSATRFQNLSADAFHRLRGHFRTGTDGQTACLGWAKESGDRRQDVFERARCGCGPKVMVDQDSCRSLCTWVCFS